MHSRRILEPIFNGYFSVTGEISGGFGRADSDEDDGPMIPDLDDVQDEDMALQVSISSTF